MQQRILTLDVDGMPIEPSVRSALRRLGQRGARLVKTDRGCIVEASHGGGHEVVGWLDGEWLSAILGAGWLVADGGGHFVLSASGRAIVRMLKASASPADAQSGAAEGRSGPAPDLPQPAGPGFVPESPLAWLRARRRKDGSPYLIDEAFAAGERLRNDFQAAAMLPRTTVDWSAIPRTRDESRGRAGRSPATGASAAQERVRRALASAPPELAGLLFDVCCLERRLQETEKSLGLPQRSAHFLLSVALNALARHYGLLPAAEPDTAGAIHSTCIRHWGAPGYRPTLDGEHSDQPA